MEEGRLWIVILGSPAYDYNFIGPFNSVGEASQYAEQHYGEEGEGFGDWWVSALDKPGAPLNVTQ